MREREREKNTMIIIKRSVRYRRYIYSAAERSQIIPKKILQVLTGFESTSSFFWGFTCVLQPIDATLSGAVCGAAETCGGASLN